jgi:hypothetical protein
MYYYWIAVLTMYYYWTVVLTMYYYWTAVLTMYYYWSNWTACAYYVVLQSTIHNYQSYWCLLMASLDYNATVDDA